MNKTKAIFFDPTINSDISSSYFDKTNYWRKLKNSHFIFGALKKSIQFCGTFCGAMYMFKLAPPKKIYEHVCML
jgi:hypothetical protein